MASYYLNEAAIELPERPFVDKTIHALDAKLEGGKTLAVFVHRRPNEAKKTLRQIVDDNVALNKTRLAGFAVLDEVQGDVGGVPGILLRTKWKQKGEVFYQLQAHVLVADKAMIFAVSAPFDAQAACDATFEQLLDTISWRAD